MSIVVASVTPEVSERQYGFSLLSHAAFIFTFNTGYPIKVGEQWGESGEEIEHATRCNTGPCSWAQISDYCKHVSGHLSDFSQSKCLKNREYKCD